MIKVAKIINTRGLKGECKLFLYTDEGKERFKKGVTLYANGSESQPLHPVSYSEYKGCGYAKFEEIPSINEAEQFKGTDLYIAREDLPDNEEGEFYYTDLVGLKAVDDTGADLGEVVDILETGATHPILRIGHGSHDFMVPFAEAFVDEVDLDEGRIVIRMMEGLK